MQPPKVIFIRSYKTKRGKVYPVNHIQTVDEFHGSKLISEGYAVKYEGEYPPKQKFKMDLKQLKYK